MEIMDSCLTFSAKVNSHGGDPTKEFPDEQIEATIKVILYKNKYRLSSTPPEKLIVREESMKFVYSLILKLFTDFL